MRHAPPVASSLDPRYVEAERRELLHRFGTAGDMLPFMSAEDLRVFKLSFGRPKDWLDLAAVAAEVPSLDVDYIEDQLIGLRGPTM